MGQIRESVWHDSVKRPEGTGKLDGNRKTDVLVIGGGMAGILLAYRLKEMGIGCIIAEATTIGSGTTGNTTAKITAQQGLIYADIMKRHGAEKARMYYDANIRAVNSFRALAESHPCDFETKTAYLYSTGNRRKLEREAFAYQKMNKPVRIEEKIPIPVSNKGALVLENQAQFNPLKFLFGLAEGLEIYEHTMIKKVEDGKAFTNEGKMISAKYIVLATHYPLINIPGLYFMKLYQHRSYVIALENAPDVKGMYLDEKKNGLSFRNYQNLLFIGGGDHKTGDYRHGGGYGVLHTLAKSAYPGSVCRYQWAAQDCMSLDGLPYVGRFRTWERGKNHLFVATGFNKWGMTGAMVAADILKNLIAHGKSEYEALYSPQRSMFTKQLGTNLLSAASGLLRIGDPRCTHMGCKLIWNRGERTWDCPCHGSRFEKDGSIIDNPAKRGLT